MKRIALVVMAATAAMLLASVALSEDEAKAPEGQTAFVNNKCNSCHTVAAVKVELRKKEEGEAAEEEGAEKSEKKKVDLSAAGTKFKAEWLSGYLMKTEALEEKKHKKKFRGTDEELKSIVAWLGTLKDEKAEKAAEGEAEASEAKSEAKPEAKSEETPEDKSEEKSEQKSEEKSE